MFCHSPAPTRSSVSVVPKSSFIGPDMDAGLLLRTAALGLAIGLLAAAPSMAQSAGFSVDGQKPPPRIANRYDHKAFQPTESDVCTGTATNNVNCSSHGDVAKTLDKIQQDIAEINKKYPPGFLSQSGNR